MILNHNPAGLGALRREDRRDSYKAQMQLSEIWFSVRYVFVMTMYSIHCRSSVYSWYMCAWCIWYMFIMYSWLYTVYMYIMYMLSWQDTSMCVYVGGSVVSVPNPLSYRVVRVLSLILNWLATIADTCHVRVNPFYFVCLAWRARLSGHTEYCDFMTVDMSYLA